MAKDKKKKNNNNKIFERARKRAFRFSIPEESKKWILGVLSFILAIIVTLSFFDLAGIAGEYLLKGLVFLIGNTTSVIPLILALGGLVFFITKYEKFLGAVVLASFLLTLGFSGIFEVADPGLKKGGYLGYISGPMLQFFGLWVTLLILIGLMLIGALIFWHLMRTPAALRKEKSEEEKKAEEKKKSFITRIFKGVAPKFKVEEIEPTPSFGKTAKTKEPFMDFKTKALQAAIAEEFQRPPLELLEPDRGSPSAGDVRMNSALIKKTFDNFGLQVEMSEINIGPTVTQYTLKPADGIKLSKITGLSNNISLALASHPIRMEAPIPGKPLVGIEVPNKERCQVRMRDLISNPAFSSSKSPLNIVLGRDVSGIPHYAELAKMPHFLVAGATGTGKTIFLNDLIVSLLYQNSPATLRLILIDPKRVEFSTYKEIPHLLTPIIYDPQKSVNSLKWLITEMERRFDVLSENGSRDIISYNSKMLQEDELRLPYIVLIIDELADLMAARGRDIEAGIVRLAQMARAVGIHLVLATQRPSVEVITGLIKANITSRVTFQVASHVDSRTVLDSGGAEKLLGLGDMLFMSADNVKPKRIQAPYVSEKEIRRVVNWVKTKITMSEINGLSTDLERALTNPEVDFEGGGFIGGEDPLYEEAKRVVIEAGKASASLLQRRLRLGYARAARLLDMLEEKRIVGPGEGAKPREIFYSKDKSNFSPDFQKESEEENSDNEWKKI